MTPHVNAVSNAIVIAQLQTGGAASSTATEEIVILYNNADADVEITDWCIEYSSAADNVGFEHCFTAPDETTELWLSSKNFASIATETFVTAHPLFAPDFIFSGGMSSSSGHLRVFDHLLVEQDKLGWGGAVSPETTATLPHAKGEVLSRDLTTQIIDTDDNSTDFGSTEMMSVIISGVYENEVIVDVCANVEDIQIQLPIGFLQDEVGDCYKDVCLNLEELQVEVPPGYTKAGDVCTLIPLEDATIFITELVANAAGSDDGKEFIELYNPLEREVQLKGYVLEVGPDYTKQHMFMDGSLEPKEYRVFSDIETGVTLPNTSGVQLRLVSPHGEVVSRSDVYSLADDDVSWALVEDNWIYTNQITPGSANKPYLQSVIDEVLGITTVYAPCPEGKVRNSDTNRCRNIVSAVSLLSPCDENQYRHPNTNRCRNSSTTTSSLTPCRVDQERNPATNRCRSLNSAASSSLTPCKEDQERNPDTNRCRKTTTLGLSSDNVSKVSDIAVESSSGTVNWPIIALTLFVTCGYMMYEWRAEVLRATQSLRLRFSSIHLW